MEARRDGQEWRKGNDTMAIERIKHGTMEYMPWQTRYGVTKFLVPQPDGSMEGHRGVLVAFQDEDNTAITGVSAVPGLSTMTISWE